MKNFFFSCLAAMGIAFVAAPNVILADAAVSTGVGDAACPCWPIGDGHGHGGPHHGGWHGGHGRH